MNIIFNSHIQILNVKKKYYKEAIFEKVEKILTINN